MAHGVPLTALRGQSYRNTQGKKITAGLKTNEHEGLISIQTRSFMKYHMFFLCKQSRVLKKAFSSCNKANGPAALKTGPHWLDKDGNLSVVFNSQNSVFSLSLISSFKQTSSIRFFSPSVNSVMFASSS